MFKKGELCHFNFLLFFEGSLILLSILLKSKSHYTYSHGSKKVNKYCTKLTVQNMLLCFREITCFMQHTASLLGCTKLQQIKLLSTLNRGILKINTSQTRFLILSVGKQMKFSAYAKGTSVSAPNTCHFYCKAHKPDLGRL